MKSLVRTLPFLSAFVPVLALAQFGGVDNFFYDIVVFINSRLVPLVFAIAFLIFVWGVFKYFIMGGHDAEKQKEGRDLMLYGIAGFVIMVSIWGIVNLIASGLGFSSTQNIQNIPNVTPYNN